MPPKPFTLLLLIPAATTGVLLTTYLYSRPFAEFKSKTYKTSSSLSPSTLASKSLSIVNPRKHIQATDSRSVTIPSNLTDEELLARFTKGYFNGWVFTPEKSIFAVLGLFGRHFIKVGFSNIPDIPASGPEVISPASLPENSLPEKYTRLVNGNFLVLDHHIKSSSSSVPGPEEEETSYIDIAFGDDRKGFAGFHRFEIFREPKEDEVTICYSSMSCDPSANKMPFPNFIFLFHIFYAERLFWDGIRGVLSN